MPKLVPLLLTKMVYSDLDIMMLRGDEDDAHVADREQDVKPHVIKNRAGGAGAGAAVAGGGGGGGGGGGAGAADEDEDDYDDEWDEEDDDDDDAEEWSLRKCAAAGLDVLSTVYGDECPDEFKAICGDAFNYNFPNELQAMDVRFPGRILGALTPPQIAEFESLVTNVVKERLESPRSQSEDPPAPYVPRLEA